MICFKFSGIIYNVMSTIITCTNYGIILIIYLLSKFHIGIQIKTLTFYPTYMKVGQSERLGENNFTWIDLWFTVNVSGQQILGKPNIWKHLNLCQCVVHEKSKFKVMHNCYKRKLRFEIYENRKFQRSKGLFPKINT